MDCQSLRKWFLHSKRDLPWRENSDQLKLDPYAVWVSEVMLQQTQVSVVIPYFERWMVQFPTIEVLANSSLEAVIKAWEGLGYYSRARNLHEGAKYVCQHHQGKLPSTEQELLKIKGLGSYTVGAILSFAFKQKAAAVDGNVIRVLTRYLAITSDISKPKTVNEIKQLAQNLLPDQEPWVISEALIELGATICTKKPKCLECPLNKNCQAFLHNQQNAIPVKLKKTKFEKIYREVLLIVHHDHCLIRKIPKGNVMSDLHEFPYIESAYEESCEKDLESIIQQHIKLDVKFHARLPLIEHGFTRFRVSLKPLIFKSELMSETPDYFWHPLKKLSDLPFSSGHRRVLHILINQYYDMNL